MSTASLALDPVSFGLDEAIARLDLKWGSGALRWGSGGLVPQDNRGAGHDGRSLGDPFESGRPDSGRGSVGGDASVVPTGFAALDAILGPGGLPRATTATFKGDVSSGKTTLALRLCAEAQARGAVVAYLDQGGTLDPVEAVARGVDLEWFVVLAPQHLDEGLAMAAALLQAQAVDLLVVDLCGARLARTARRVDRAEAIRRLSALARRSGALLVVLEPADLHRGSGHALDGALVESSSLRLELARRDWIRLGREVVGQRVEVVVAKNRFGPPGRQVQLEILYADGTDRDGCLGRRELLAAESGGTLVGPFVPVESGRTLATPFALRGRDATGEPTHPIAPFQEGSRDASPPSRLATSPAPPGAGRLQLLSGRPGDPRRTAVGARDRARREPRGARLRGTEGVAARRSA